MKINPDSNNPFGKKEPLEITDNIDILADDGRELYSLRLFPGGRLEIGAHITCKHEGRILYSRLTISPDSPAQVTISRPEYLGDMATIKLIDETADTIDEVVVSQREAELYAGLNTDRPVLLGGKLRNARSVTCVIDDQRLSSPVISKVEIYMEDAE